MVTGIRKRFDVPQVEAALQKCRVKEKEQVIEELKSLPVRQKAPPPPQGGIALREAARKYNINYSTLSRWVKRGWVSVTMRTRNWLYIDEQSLIHALKDRDN